MSEKELDLKINENYLEAILQELRKVITENLLNKSFSSIQDGSLYCKRFGNGFADPVCTIQIKQQTKEDSLLKEELLLRNLNISVNFYKPIIQINES